jgi:hypothetical protein
MSLMGKETRLWELCVGINTAGSCVTHHINPDNGAGQFPKHWILTPFLSENTLLHSVAMKALNLIQSTSTGRLLIPMFDTWNPFVRRNLGCSACWLSYSDVETSRPLPHIWRSNITSTPKPQDEFSAMPALHWYRNASTTWEENCERMSMTLSTQVFH